MLKVIIKANFKRAFAVKKALDVPLEMYEPYYTLAAIGVASGFRGRKVGRRLLDKAHEIAESNPNISGVYLVTGDSGNQSLYEHMGYRTIYEKKAQQLTIYHMFRPNKSKQKQEEQGE